MAASLADLRSIGLGGSVADGPPHVLLFPDDASGTPPLQDCASSVQPAYGSPEPSTLPEAAHSDALLRLASVPTDDYLAERITALVFTSPAASQPSIEMLMAVLTSFRFLPGLDRCPLLVTCDGPGRVTGQVRPKKGFITEELHARYGAYVERLQATVGESRLLVLPEREGFGRAVQAALSYVKTPYVLICQHDNMFVRPIDLRGVVRTMDEHSEILKCVHFVSPKTTFDEDGGDVDLSRIQDRLGTGAGVARKMATPPLSRPASGTSDGAPLSLNFWPMPSWLERNHVCSTALYRDFVLGPSTRLKPGQFIEETFGQSMRRDLLANGCAAHAKYGVWRLLDSPEPATLHLDGRTYLPEEERRRRGWPVSDLFLRLERQHRAWLQDARC